MKGSTRPCAPALASLSGAGALLAAVAIVGCGSALAAEPRPATAPRPDEPEVAAAPVTDEAEAASADDAIGATPEKAEKNPCEVAETGEEPWLDQMRREVFETICNTARRFDAFFGTRRFDAEARRTHGRGGLRAVWDEAEGFDVDGHLRVRVDLPNLDERLSAFFGRDEEDDFLSGAERDVELLPDFFRQEGEKEWLVGLGYRPVSTGRFKLDFDAGVDLDTPIEPYVRGRYRQFWLPGRDLLLRTSQTAYWQNQHGFGVSAHADAERAVTRRSLARWSGRMTLDEATEGVEWYAAFTWFQGIDATQGLAVRALVGGETDAEVEVARYGFAATYRRQMLREWFFGEIVGGVTWPKELREQQREAAWNIGFGFEIQFSGEDLGAGL